MTPEIVAAMHPPRLPANFTAPVWQDFVAAFGIGLILAVLILTLAAPALRRKPRQPLVADRVRAAAALPRQERMLNLARLLAETGGQLPDEDRAAIYSVAGGDPERIEMLILRTRGKAMPR